MLFNSFEYVCKYPIDDTGNEMWMETPFKSIQYENYVRCGKKTSDETVKLTLEESFI